MSSTTRRVAAIRARADGWRDTWAPPSATARTCAMVRGRPSRETGEAVMAGSVRLRLPVVVPIVVELDVGLGFQRDEEGKGEVAVRRLRDPEHRAPVVQVARQRDRRSEEHTS